ncbi:unnamed protein product [Caenorhabditis brenneri]
MTCCGITVGRAKRFVNYWFGCLVFLIAVLHLFMGAVLAFAIFVMFGLLEMIYDDYTIFVIAFVPSIIAIISFLICVTKLDQWAKQPRQYSQAPMKSQILTFDDIPVRFRRSIDRVEFVSNHL